MQLTLVRANGKKTNDETIRSQVDYIVKRGLDSIRGKAWKCDIAQAKAPYQKEGLWVFTYTLTFEQLDSYRGDFEKRFEEIREMISQTGGGSKFGEYPWKLDGAVTVAPPPAAVTVAPAPEPVKATASPIVTTAKVTTKVEEEEDDEDDVPLKAALTAPTASPVVAPKKDSPQKPLTLKKLRKLLARANFRDVATAMLDMVSWDKLMLELANTAHYRSSGMPRKSAKAKVWIARGRVFHRAMDETILSKVKGGVFKIVRRDIYECKCKKRFLVDPTREKNIKFDIGQCEFVVTCPACGRQEDIKKATEVFKKLDQKE